MARHVARLDKVARMASMQSRRAWLPSVEPVQSFDELAARPGIALAAPGGSPPALAHPAIAVGPEGGWSEGEIGREIPTVSLANTVLRTETAAVAAGALLVALRAGLVTARCGHASG